MFVILQVPNLLESAFSYLRYNYIPHTQGVAFMLPSRAYGLMRAGGWFGIKIALGLLVILFLLTALAL